MHPNHENLPNGDIQSEGKLSSVSSVMGSTEISLLGLQQRSYYYYWPYTTCKYPIPWVQTWLLNLQRNNYVMKYKPGYKNVSDKLLRNPLLSDTNTVRALRLLLIV